MTNRKLVSVTIEGYEVIEKMVARSDSSGRIYLPVDWIGKRVKVILLEK